MKKNGESIYQTRGNAVAPQPWGVVTSRDKTWYVHILDRPSEKFLFIPAVKEKVLNAVLLNTNIQLKFKSQAEGVFIYLNNINMDDIDTIVRLDLQ